MMKKLSALVLAFCIGSSLLACGGERQIPPETTADTVAVTEQTATQPPKTRIGISLPNDWQDSWRIGAREMVQQLEKLGCEAVVAFADDDTAQQARQLRELMNDAVDGLIVAAIDSHTLLEELAQAHEQGIPVVAYDRLLMDTDAVCSYVSFDAESLGRAVAERIVQMQRLDAADGQKERYTVEFFMGAPEDNSALLFYTGVMDVLRPWLDSGVLVCRSGRTAFEDTCVPVRDAEMLWQNVAARLEAQYSGDAPDIVCTDSDRLAEACVRALTEAGCSPEDWPLITGQGGDIQAVERVAKGLQAVTVYQDYRALAERCAQVACQMAKGGTQIGENGFADNHIAKIPVSHVSAEVIHPDNYRAQMIDSGVYTQEQLQLDKQEITVAPEAAEDTRPTEVPRG